MSAKDVDKRAWIYRLEEESWQAELLVSGAAIFGCLLLPGLIRNVEDFILYTVNRESMMLWYINILFANMLAYTLILTFVIHFIVRALWIGIVGFNSAYPEGYKPNERFSKDYQQKLLDDFGDTYGYIQQLDKSASTIFGTGFAIALVALGYVLLVSVIGLVFYLAGNYVSEGIAMGVLVAGLVIILGFSVVSAVWSSEKYRDTETAKKYHYPLTKAFGRLFMNVGYRPASYVMNVLTSQSADKPGGVWKSIGMSLAVGMVGGLLGVSNMQVRTFIDRAYVNLGSDPSTIQADYYEDTEEAGYVYHPVLPSYKMKAGDLLTVFLPLPNREKFILEKNCDLPEATSERSRAGTNARQRRKVDCARQYYRFFLNENEILNYELDRYWYGTQEQYGFLLTLYDYAAKPGKNEFKVESKYLNDEGEPRIARIPFYYFLE